MVDRKLINKLRMERDRLLKLEKKQKKAKKVMDEALAEESKSFVRRLRKKKLTPEQKQAIISRISMIIWSSKQKRS